MRAGWGEVSGSHQGRVHWANSDSNLACGGRAQDSGDGAYPLATQEEGLVIGLPFRQSLDASLD